MRNIKVNDLYLMKNLEFCLTSLGKPKHTTCFNYNSFFGFGLSKLGK